MWDWARITIIITIVTEAVGALIYIMRLEGRLNVHEERFNTVDAKFEASAARHEELRQWLTRVEVKLDRALELRQHD